MRNLGYPDIIKNDTVRFWTCRRLPVNPYQVVTTMRGQVHLLMMLLVMKPRMRVRMLRSMERISKISLLDLCSNLPLFLLKLPAPAQVLVDQSSPVLQVMDIRIIRVKLLTWASGSGFDRQVQSLRDWYNYNGGYIYILHLQYVVIKLCIYVNVTLTKKGTIYMHCMWDISMANLGYSLAIFHFACTGQQHAVPTELALAKQRLAE